MDRRGFLGSLVAFACSPAFPAPLTYKGVPLVFDDDIYRSTNIFWNMPPHPEFIVAGPVFMEEMRRQWASLEALSGEFNKTFDDCKWIEK